MSSAQTKLLPILDLEFRLLTALPVVDLQLQVLGSNAFLELERRTALIGALIGTLAAEEGHQLMLAHLEIAQVEAVHASFEQGLDFTRRIQVVDDFLLIDLQSHRIQSEEIPYVHGKEHRDLSIRREEQLLLEHE